MKRWRVSKVERPRSRWKFVTSTTEPFHSDASSIDLENVYALRKLSPCEKRFSTLNCSA